MIESLGLKTKKDECGDLYIPGKLGQIYDYGDDEHLGAMFLPDTPQKGWKNRREELVTAGATVIQNGDMEGTVIFPKADKKTLRLACRLLGVRQRKVNPAVLANLKPFKKKT